MKKIELKDFKEIYENKNVFWGKLRNKSVLITGSTGLIGLFFLKYLLWLNNEHLDSSMRIIALVRNKKKLEDRLSYLSTDSSLTILEQELTGKIKVDIDLNFIIHIASNATPKYFFSDPVGTINANAIGTYNLLQLACENPIESFLFFSTGEVYGDMLSLKAYVKEEEYGVVDPLDIRNCYAESKRLAENMCCSYAHQYKLPVKIVRPAHTYGYSFDMNDDRAMVSFVKDVLAGKNIVLKSDGSAKRSFIYIADAIVAYFLVLLEGENANAYNVSNSYETSVLDLAKTIIKVNENPELQVVFENVNLSQSFSSNTTNGMLDISKVSKLGWKPTTTEEVGYRKVLAYYKEGKDNG